MGTTVISAHTLLLSAAYDQLAIVVEIVHSLRDKTRQGASSCGVVTPSSLFLAGTADPLHDQGRRLYHSLAHKSYQIKVPQIFRFFLLVLL